MTDHILNICQTSRTTEWSNEQGHIVGFQTLLVIIAFYVNSFPNEVILNKDSIEVFFERMQFLLSNNSNLKKNDRIIWNICCERLLLQYMGSRTQFETIIVRMRYVWNDRLLSGIK